MGRLYTKPNTFLRRMPLLIGLIGGIGGIFLDFDHFLHLVTQGAVPFTFLHQPSFVSSIIILTGCVIALCRRLYSTLVLAGKKDRKYHAG